MASEEQQIDGFVISCDYYKCFDVIEWESITKAMSFFGFSSILIKWIEIMYRAFELQVQNNGNFSATFFPTHGCHQGGPASNAIFLCVAELLAISIRNDSVIQGIFVRRIMNLLNQYADDMDSMMTNRQQNLDQFLKLVHTFHCSTGFTLSYEKTTIYQVGSMKKSNAKLYTAQELNWSDQINVLGVEIRDTNVEQIQSNYPKIIEKCEQIMKSWTNRNVSLLGKINVVNTLVASLYTYKMMVLPLIPDTMINRIHQSIEHFIWNGHKPKIPTSVLQSVKEEGGMKLVNIKTKDMSLKAAWVKLIMNGSYPADIVYDDLQSGLTPECMIWCCNLQMKDVKKSFKKDSFWRDVLASWAAYHYEDTKDDDQILWYNSLILIENLPVIWKDVASAGLMYVSQLVDEAGYITATEAETRYGLDVMRLNMLKVAIPKNIKKSCMSTHGASFKDPSYAKYMASEKPASYIYNKLMRGGNAIKNIERRWENELLDEEQGWLVRCIQNIKYSTGVMKLRSFQYRLLCRGIVTNVHLKRWGIKNSDMCTFAMSCLSHILTCFLSVNMYVVYGLR